MTLLVEFNSLLLLMERPYFNNIRNGNCIAGDLIWLRKGFNSLGFYNIYFTLFLQVRSDFITKNN
ncbi:hypothetical protein PBNK5_23690 [Pectobacterium brasiliense]